MASGFVVVYPIHGSSHFLSKAGRSWELSPHREDAHRFDTEDEARKVRDEIVPGGAVFTAERVERTVMGRIGIADGGRRT